MEWLRIWIMGIAGAILFGAVCEMILPEGGIKKYIRVVLGVVLVCAIAKPLTDLAGEEAPDLGLPQGQAGAYAVSQTMEDTQRQQVIRLYTSELEAKMEADARQSMPQTEIEISLAVSEEENSFGEPQSASVKLSPAGAGAQQEEIRRALSESYHIPKDKIWIQGT